MVQNLLSQSVSLSSVIDIIFTKTADRFFRFCCFCFQNLKQWQATFPKQSNWALLFLLSSAFFAHVKAFSRYHAKLVLSLLLFLALINLPLKAEAGTWSPAGGPDGALVHQLTTSPNYAADQTILAVTGHPGSPTGSLFKSTDGGTSWFPLSTGTVGIETVAISPDYASDQMLFASGGGGYLTGLLKSTDGGATWNTIKSNVYVLTITISPNYSVDQTIFIGTAFEVLKSTDGGMSWLNITPPGVCNDCGIGYSSIATSPNYAIDRTVFTTISAPSYMVGLYKSTDGGNIWNRLNTTSPYGEAFSAVLVSPGFVADQTLFAFSSMRVIKSIDGGTSWSVVSTGLPAGRIKSIAVSSNYSSDNTLFVGMNAAHSDWNAVQGLGIFKSTDGGASWTAVNTGLTNLEVNAIALSPNYAADQTVFAGTYDSAGVFKSTDAGASWSLSNSRLTGLYINDVKLSPDYKTDHTIFAYSLPFTSTYYGSLSSPGSLFKSIDDGKSWTSVATGMTNIGLVNQQDLGMVSLSPSYASDQTVTATLYGISRNGGSSWTGLDFGQCGGRFRFDIFSPSFTQDQTIFHFASTCGNYWSYGGEVYKSIDGGNTWNELVPAPGGARAYAISPNFIVDQTIFAGASNISKTINGGITWTDTTAGISCSPYYGCPSLNSLAISPNYSIDSTVFAGTSNGVYRSNDGGASWIAVNTGLSGQVSSVVVSPNFSNDSTVFAGLKGGGVYKSTDAGVTWNAVNAGLANLMVHSLAISPGYPCDGTLFAGTEASVWKYTDTEAMATCYADNDGDGYYPDTDCNDNDPYIYPNATEVCDGIDNNCDGTADEVVISTFYMDSDNDGFGNLTRVIGACAAPTGYVSNADDCNDSDNRIYPGAPEIPSDGIDQDCNGGDFVSPVFNLTITPITQSIIPGEKAYYVITVNPSSNFNEFVEFSLLSDPPVDSLITVDFSPTAVMPGGSSIITVTTTETTPDGLYILSIQGVVGNTVKRVSLILGVNTIPPELLTTTKLWAQEYLNRMKEFEFIFLASDVVDLFKLAIRTQCLTLPVAGCLMEPLISLGKQAVDLYAELKADPPDPNYQEVVILATTDSFVPLGNSTYIQAKARLANVLAQQNNILNAILVTLERLQGAIVDKEPLFIILQAKALKNFHQLLMVNQHELRESISPFSSEFNSYINPIYDTVVQNIIRLNNEGFSVEERNYLEDNGLSMAEIQTLEGNFRSLVLLKDLRESMQTLSNQWIEFINNTILMALEHSITGSEKIIISFDNVPPTISTYLSLSPNTAGWYNGDVTVTFHCFDNESGIAICPDPVTVINEGFGEVISGTAVDLAGNSASASVTVNVDKTPPVLNMPVLSSTYIYNARESFNFGIFDLLSGIEGMSATLNGVSISSGVLLTLIKLGTNTFTLTATDLAGNTNTQTITFEVQYIFSDFLPPIQADGSKVFKLGSTIPIKFQLMDFNNIYISTAKATLTLQQFSNDTLVGEPIVVESNSGANSGNMFRYDFENEQYIFNLNTKSLSKGLWQLQVHLDDGTTKTGLIRLK